MAQTAGHPYLLATELIIEILRYLCSPLGSTTDIDSAGLVCKSWHEPAMAIKWETTALYPLLSTLGPVLESQDGLWVRLTLIVSLMIFDVY